MAGEGIGQIRQAVRDGDSICKGCIQKKYAAHVARQLLFYVEGAQFNPAASAADCPPHQWQSSSDGRTCHIKELLLCSDGLTDLVEIDDIEEIIEKYPAPIEMVHMLYDKAMENGGHDNISIVYIKLEDNK